jgi:hypothetical protein
MLGFAEGKLADALRFAAGYVAEVNESAAAGDGIQHADKVSAEAALLLLVAARAGRSDSVPARQLAQVLRPVARSERLRLILRYRPGEAHVAALPALVLRQLGDVDAAFDEAVRDALGSPLRDAAERLPFREMDARWVRSLAGGGAPDVTDLLPLSVLSRGVDPASCSRSDLYALTHSVMYATDLGRGPLPPSVRTAVAVSTDIGLAWTLSRDDLDLLAELLFIPLLTTVGWSPLARLGWQVLFEIWQKLGFLPGPALRHDQLRSGGPEAVRHARDGCYHTFFAGGVLAGLALANPERVPTAAVPGATAGTGRTGSPPMTHVSRHRHRLAAAHAPALAAIDLLTAIRGGDFGARDEFLQLHRPTTNHLAGSPLNLHGRRHDRSRREHPSIP